MDRARGGEPARWKAPPISTTSKELAPWAHLTGQTAAAACQAEQVVQGTDPARIALIARSHELRCLLNHDARNSMRAAGRLGPDNNNLVSTPLAVGVAAGTTQGRCISALRSTRRGVVR